VSKLTKISNHKTDLLTIAICTRYLNIQQVGQKTRFIIIFGTSYGQYFVFWDVKHEVRMRRTACGLWYIQSNFRLSLHAHVSREQQVELPQHHIERDPFSTDTARIPIVF